MDMALVGLYAGIGGLELGFQAVGMQASLLADRDPDCQRLLSARFPDARIAGDVASLDCLPPNTRVVTAGFPCQNLSMAGDKTGIDGQKSSDIWHLFKLLQNQRPTLIIENVYFMLHLNRGDAMRSLVQSVEALGYRWAYRVVNTLAFGLPQRRRRVFFVASIELDPNSVLFGCEDANEILLPRDVVHPIGFYWTEGRSGVGLAVDAIPPLKVASGLGIPSAPAVLFPNGEVLTPGIETCERLQGFDPGWTDLEYKTRRSPRWSMVGNAVSVPAAKWLATRLTNPEQGSPREGKLLNEDAPWPKAAFGENGRRYLVYASEFPTSIKRGSLLDYTGSAWSPLSERALRGFLQRARGGTLRFLPGFIEAVQAEADRRNRQSAIASATAPANYRP